MQAAARIAILHLIPLIVFFTLANAASGAYFADVVFADNPTQVVSIAISETGSGLKDYDQYVDLNTYPAASTGTGTAFTVGVGIRIEVTSCAVTNGRAQFVIRAAKRTLLPRENARPGFTVQEYGDLDLDLALNEWLLINTSNETNAISMLSEDRNALGSATGIRIREAQDRVESNGESRSSADEVGKDGL